MNFMRLSGLFNLFFSALINFPIPYYYLPWIYYFLKLNKSDAFKKVCDHLLPFIGAK